MNCCLLLLFNRSHRYCGCCFFLACNIFWTLLVIGQLLQSLGLRRSHFLYFSLQPQVYQPNEVSSHCSFARFHLASVGSVLSLLLGSISGSWVFFNLCINLSVHSIDVNRFFPPSAVSFKKGIVSVTVVHSLLLFLFPQNRLTVFYDENLKLTIRWLSKVIKTDKIVEKISGVTFDENNSYTELPLIYCKFSTANFCLPLFVKKCSSLFSLNRHDNCFFIILI